MEISDSKQNYITSYNFLDRYLIFKRMVPNVHDWQLSSLEANPPRYYRLKELLALMKAFNLGSDLYKDFHCHSFLENRTKKDLEPVLDDINKYAYEIEHKQDISENEYLEEDIEFIFEYFIKFIDEARRLLSFNSGWIIAGSISARYIIHKTENAIKAINQPELREIERVVCKIIDPDEKTFPLAELIEKYDYTNVNLKTIDLDHL